MKKILLFGLLASILFLSCGEIAHKDFESPDWIKNKFFVSLDKSKNIQISKNKIENNFLLPFSVSGYWIEVKEKNNDFFIVKVQLEENKSYIMTFKKLGENDNKTTIEFSAKLNEKDMVWKCYKYENKKKIESETKVIKFIEK